MAATPKLALSIVAASVVAVLAVLVAAPRSDAALVRVNPFPASRCTAAR